jgi:hypothetical protein
MGSNSSPKVSDEGLKSTTDPALLVKGRRYAIRDLDHPEFARSVGVFDEIRPSQWTGEDSVYFIDGQIGDVPQSIFGHPTRKRCEYSEVVEFRVRQWNSKLNLWEWDTVTSTSEVNGEAYFSLASLAFVPAANWEVVDPQAEADPFPAVEAGATAAAVAESDTPVPDHDGWENAVPYVSDGPLGHGWECGVCGEFLQAG